MGVSAKLSSERKCEIAGVCILALTAVLFLALATDGYRGQTARSLSDLGAGGSMLAGLLYILFGKGSHILYLVTGVWGVMLLRHQKLDRAWSRALGFFILMLSVSGFIAFAFDQGDKPGGAVGAFVVYMLKPVTGSVGSSVVTFTTTIIGMLLATEFLFVRMIKWCCSTFILVLRSIEELRQEFLKWYGVRAEKKSKETNVITVKSKRAKRTMNFSKFFSLSTYKKRKVRDAVAAVREAHREEDDGKQPPEPVAMRVTAPPRIGMDDNNESQDAPADAPVDAEQLEFEAGDSGEYITTKPVPDPVAPIDPARLRRKTVIDDIPEGYVYPKRYTKPPIDLFDEAPRRVRKDLSSALRQTGKRLEETLLTFGIEAHVTDITRGPTITRFEIEPASGIKVSRFLALADDIALALKAHGVRVEAPIPGKGKVGIEIPNDQSEPVMMREMLEASCFRKEKGQLTLAMGKDIAGAAQCADLATMPHLLVAGATGSGKTIYVKSVLASLLMSKTPDELQLVLIDPKMVELSIFNDIPHLITPVVIDPKKASGALGWLINEMEERYRLFAHLRVRNIEVYNESVDNGEIEVEAEEGEEAESVAAIRKLPYIVCVIDELADLMMLARAEVEDAIARLAQLARAVGIHLVIATQRPSVDVLTGVIKANFPARVSFQVSSRVDSRCILDEIGAERLIGRGDMLLLPPGHSKPIRLQGADVGDDDMNRLISYLKTQAPPQYRDEIEKYGQQKDSLKDIEDESDELFDDAVRVVTETGQASISMVQRRLRVGYTRAARLIDMMEIRGIVGPHVGSKAREILVSAHHDNDEVA